MSCNKPLAAGQWWNFCGETDMGQTMPALCIECGGEYKLKEQFPDLRGVGELMNDAPVEIEDRMSYLPKEDKND